MSILDSVFKSSKEEQRQFLDKLLSQPTIPEFAIISFEDIVVEEEQSLDFKLQELKNEILGQVNTIQPSNGKDGKDGINGKDGLNGLDGKNGKDGKAGTDGKDGSDGVGIASVKVDLDNHLVVYMTDGSEIDAGEIQVQAGSITQVIQQKGETVSYTLRYDQVSDTLAYKGEAPVGTPETADSWRIQKLTYGTDGDVNIEWVEGRPDFKFIWNDRASLNYK